MSRSGLKSLALPPPPQSRVRRVRERVRVAGRRINQPARGAKRRQSGRECNHRRRRRRRNISSTQEVFLSLSLSLSLSIAHSSIHPLIPALLSHVRIRAFVTKSLFGRGSPGSTWLDDRAFFSARVCLPPPPLPATTRLVASPHHPRLLIGK
jgi:hypothetical protein